MKVVVADELTVTPMVLVEQTRDGKPVRVLVIREGVLSRKCAMLLGKLLAHV